MLQLAIGLVLLAFIGGVVQAVVSPKRKTVGRGGWLYFISNGPETPVKVGLSKYDPTKQRLGELQTMSPTPLRVIYKLPVRDRFAAETMVHAHLAPYRKNGAWFDRDATLAFIEHMKGSY